MNMKPDFQSWAGKEIHQHPMFIAAWARAKDMQARHEARRAGTEPTFDKDAFMKGPWDFTRLVVRVPPFLQAMYAEQNPLLITGSYLYFLLLGDLSVMLANLGGFLPLCWIVVDIDGRYQDPCLMDPRPTRGIEPPPRQISDMPVIYFQTKGRHYNPGCMLILERISEVIRPPSSRIII